MARSILEYGKTDKAPSLSLTKGFPLKEAGVPGKDKSSEFWARFCSSEPRRRILSQADKFFVTRHIRANQDATINSSSGIERFEARASILPDGRLLLVAKGAPLKTRSFDNMILMGSEYGAYIKYFVATRPEMRFGLLLPGTPEIEALRKKKVVVAFLRTGKIEDIYEWDYSASHHGAVIDEMLDDLTKIDIEIKKEDRCVPRVDVLKLHGLTFGTIAQKFFSREDWLQFGWLEQIKEELEESEYCIEEIECIVRPLIIDKKIPNNMPVLHRVCELISSEKLRGVRLTELLLFLSDPQVAADFVYETIEKDVPEELNEKFTFLVQIHKLGTRISSLTRYGRNFLYFSNDSQKFEPAPISPSDFPILDDKAAQAYWKNTIRLFAWDANLYLDPEDFPADRQMLAKWFVDNPLSVDVAATEQASQDLLDEAVALRKWTIPPRAKVAFEFGPFVSAEITEVGQEVYFVWRNKEGHFWAASFGVKNKAMPEAYHFTDDAGVRAQIKLIMAAIVRDFLVAEERRKVFAVTRQRPQKAPKNSNATRIVYLPRVRYVNDAAAPSRLQAGLAQGERSRHFVNSHFRKVQPSPLQLAIASNENIRVPNCRIPDDCIDPRRLAFFGGRAFFRELITTLEARVSGERRP